MSLLKNTARPEKGDIYNERQRKWEYTRRLIKALPLAMAFLMAGNLCKTNHLTSQLCLSTFDDID